MLLKSFEGFSPLYLLGVLTNRQPHERISLITGALSPKIDAPAFAGFQKLATHAPVRAEEYLSTRPLPNFSEIEHKRKGKTLFFSFRFFSFL